MGARYQVISAVIAAPTTTRPPVTMASLTASHRARGTDWLQARRQVPYSSSRAMSGAPTRTPIRPGTIRATDQNAMLTSDPNSPSNAETAPWQAFTWMWARHPVRPSWPNAVRIEVPTRIA